MFGDKFPMLTGVLTPFLLIFSHYLTSIQSSIIPSPPPFNLSHFLYPKVTAFTESDNPPSEPPPFLQGVLEAIVKKEKWSMEDIRVSEVDVKKAKCRTVLRYEFRVRFGKAEIVLKMYEELSEWKKIVDLMKNGTLNFEALARIIAFEAVIDSFKIEGPFELRAASDADQLLLMLPLNMSHSGLKQISVGEGITVEIKGAREISMYHPPTISTYGHWSNVASIWPDLCTTPKAIRILGPTSVVAHRNLRPSTHVQTTFTSKNGIKLLPDKCYVTVNYEKPSHLYNSISGRIGSLEKVVRSFLNDSSSKNSAFRTMKTRINPLSVFHFRLEMERDIRDDDAFWSTSAEWRTRPTVERVFFEVLGRIEDGVLRPLVVKKVRPVNDTDTFAWSSLSSNISFTKFPSALVPPEALMLDVKW